MYTLILSKPKECGAALAPPHTLWVLCNLVKFKKHTQNLYRPPRRRYRFWGRQL